MRGKLNRWFVVCLPAVALLLSAVLPHMTHGQAKPAASPDSSIVKSVGTIKTVTSDSIIVSVESGGDVTAALSTTTRILGVPPGEKDLKNATPLRPQDLQPGDRVLVRGQATSDPHAVSALAVIVMKQSDVSARHQQERDDWRKRGVDGLVTKVDVAAKTVTISSGGLGTKHDIAVQFTKDTILRRYAPNSVRFEDARLASADQIKVGDQLRARGAKNADSSEVAAEEIVSGTFRNIAGTVTAVDPATNSVTVQDRIAKSTVVVKISSESQVKKLPPEMAQRIGLRLKGGAAANGEAANAPPASAQTPSAQNPATQNHAPAGASQSSEARRWPGAGGPGAPGGAPNGNGPPDFQRLLSRLPNAPLSELEKGAVVMILSTQGEESGTATAITFLAGVEPILTAAPSRSASLLTPWSFSGSPGESEGSQ